MGNELKLLGACSILFLLVQYVSATGHCVYRGTTIMKGAGLTAPRGKCYLMTCSKEGKLNRVDCFKKKAAPGCHKSGLDLTKIYPQCCPFDVCPGDIDYDELELKI